MKIFSNIHNYKCFFRQVVVFKNPLRFWFLFVFAPSAGSLDLRTPVGNLRIRIRNRQTLRTVWSVFVRLDYRIGEKPYAFLDVGSNVGISAAYFLTRNKNNKILCVEPDPANLPFLEKNLAQFGDRCKVMTAALVGDNCKASTLPFYPSSDGKYSSLTPIKESLDVVNVVAIRVADLEGALCKMSFMEGMPFVIKLDTEGNEAELIQAFVPFCRLNQVYKLFAEGDCLDSGDLSPAIYSRKIVNGYITLFVNKLFGS